ncbi:hypothetical protein [Stenomitos frigidus]|uniref:Uncharacterized protein n=1 Tax=Stenomitos frigidus ULC18 TaxID=2107698 RepID=A0A2T1E2L3_9CYAN|nr:hypothetical protein [Stenomitos frigidus]PSB26978.1 hypothetical protein C7B82_17625 [Stenomitos frigidus ULC18]
MNRRYSKTNQTIRVTTEPTHTVESKDDFERLASLLVSLQLDLKASQDHSSSRDGSFLEDLTYMRLKHYRP